MKPDHSNNDNIQVFSTTDDRLKIIGEIFGNKTSRTILALLLAKDMTIMQISQESKVSANLVMYHLKKMLQSDIIMVTKHSKSSRGHPLRFYRAKPAIVIVSKDTASRVDKSKSFLNALEKIVRFSAIGIVGAISWILTNSHHALESAFKYPRPTLPPYMSPVEPQVSNELLFPLIATSGIVTLGFLINHYLPQIVKR